MKKTIKAALKGITTATAGFLKKRGIYVVALALISAAALSAVLTVKQPNGADPAQTDDPASEVNTDIGDRLNQAQLPIATPTPSPTATPTPMPDFTPAPPTPKPTAVQKLSPPVRGEVIWGFAVNELIYSRTLDQWTTHTGVDVARAKGQRGLCRFRRNRYGDIHGRFARRYGRGKGGKRHDSRIRQS